MLKDKHELDTVIPKRIGWIFKIISCKLFFAFYLNCYKNIYLFVLNFKYKVFFKEKNTILCIQNFDRHFMCQKHILLTLRIFEF